MVEISSGGIKAPGPYAGVNANFCKNPKCANFGVAETPNRARRSLGAPSAAGDYTRVASGKGKPILKDESAASN